MARASVDGAGWRWREERAGCNNPVSDLTERDRQPAPATLARTVAPLFGLGAVAALAQDRSGSSRVARYLPKPKIDSNACHASISTSS